MCMCVLGYSGADMAHFLLEVCLPERSMNLCSWGVLSMSLSTITGTTTSFQRCP